MNRGRTVAHRGEPWRTGMNRVEPAHAPGCFKMFNTTEVNRDELGRMSNTGVNWGDTGSFREHPWLHRGLSRDKPCAMKTKF